MTAGGSVTAPLVHAAFLYRSPEEYVDGLVSWVREGLAADEPVLLAVTPDQRALLEPPLGGAAEKVVFADANAAGANPARMVAAIRSFTDAWPDRRTRAAGALVWPGRSPAQLNEVFAHEAVVNLAFAQTATTFLCPFEADDERVVADAQRTHPLLRGPEGMVPSPTYAPGPLLLGDQPEPTVHPLAQHLATISAVSELARLRGLVGDRARSAGVPVERCAEFVTAVGEVATNAVKYGGSAGEVSWWVDPQESAFVVRIDSAGRITDPLAGRELCPTPTGGRGMWLVNQLCDLAETHSGPWGTSTRMYVRI